MKDAEFISYTPTPNDSYTLGIATVRLSGKYIVRYKHLKTKDGTSTFFASASVALETDGQKKFFPAFQLDSNADQTLLQNFLRENCPKVQTSNQMPF